MNKLMIILASFILAVTLFFALEPEAPTKSHRLITLTSDNTVVLNMPIGGDSAKDVQLELMKKSASLARRAPIYLILNSPGGSISDGQNIIETAQGLSQPVHTISLFSASMSFVIGQLLDTRYVLDTSTIMSHRAYAGGLEGQVPGNLITRTNNLLDMVLSVDSRVAKRVGISLEEYQNAIKDEMWLYGSSAVAKKYADETVRVKCDKSLQGASEPKAFTLWGMKVLVTWHKCPLIAEPLSVQISGENTENPYLQALVRRMLYDREGFVRRGGIQALGGYK